MKNRVFCVTILGFLALVGSIPAGAFSYSDLAKPASYPDFDPTPIDQLSDMDRVRRVFTVSEYCHPCEIPIFKKLYERAARDMARSDATRSGTSDRDGSRVFAKERYNKNESCGDRNYFSYACGVVEHEKKVGNAVPSVGAVNVHTNR